MALTAAEFRNAEGYQTFSPAIGPKDQRMVLPPGWHFNNARNASLE
jgi:hypothetical protein